MPPKRVKPVEHHPPSSSEDEVEENGIVEEESSSEEEQEPEPEPEPCLSKTLNLTPNPQSSNTESPTENESGTDAESEPEVASTPVKSSSKKRGGSDWKRGKENGAVEKKSENGKKVSQRVWSDEDVIALLEGIIEYKAKRVIDPIADIRAFRDFIKGKLHFDVELNQLKRKMSMLKYKLLRNHFKNDEDRTFSNPHRQLVYDLSMRIWCRWLSKTRARRGKNNNGGDKMDFEMESQSGAKKRMKFDTSFYSVAYMDEFVKKKGLELLDAEKRAEMEEKWKKLQLEELKLFARKRELLKQQSCMIMASFED